MLAARDAALSAVARSLRHVTATALVGRGRRAHGADTLCIEDPMHILSPARTPSRAAATTWPHQHASRDLRAWFTTRAGQLAREQLTPLVEQAAGLDPDDHAAGGRLRDDAHRTTSRLAAAGLLPPHLVVGPSEAVVAVVRILAVAQRHVTPSVQDHPLPQN
jgi:hypothetical protein